MRFVVFAVAAFGAVGSGDEPLEIGSEPQFLIDTHVVDNIWAIRYKREKVHPGFDYEECAPFAGDSVAHEVGWKQASMNALAGQVVRLEFYLRNADLYTFRAAGRAVK